ncbi:hypothetical protein SAMN02745133_03100 [Desulforamulus putei DSM 12395]|uniref:Uncharacterized protein n=2 Tax=Desulforamulus putei TaxID=74701 RepID=A0A1M5D479_9FIRM|nr:hypothetical protein SAMN02745133_03100 [Desulforamulus putei DSM 12395]
MALNVDPIAPGQVVEALGKTADSLSSAGQSLATPFLKGAFTVSGILLLVGALIYKLDKRLFLTGLFAMFGSIMGFILTHHTGEVVGIIKGGADALFKDLKSKPAVVQPVDPAAQSSQQPAQQPAQQNTQQPVQQSNQQNQQ